MKFSLLRYLVASLSILTANWAVGSVLQPPQMILRPSDEGYPVVEDRAFQGIPGIAVSENGRLWATWYSGPVWSEDEKNYIILATSGDDGASWQEVMVVDPDGVAGPLRAFDPVLWFDPQGQLWLFWAQAVADGHRLAQTWAMRAVDPEAADTEWTAPFHIAPGVMMNKPTVLRNGDWVLPISDWEAKWNVPVNAPSGVVYLSKPEWKGDYFRYLGGAMVPQGQRSADEHMVVERNNGDLWMLIRTRYGMGESVSTDGGKTWPEITPSPILHPASRFFITRLNSGNLLLVKHGLIDEPLTSRVDIRAFISKDDGVTWQGGLLLDQSGTYPDGQQAADGTIYITYDHSRGHLREILMATFKEEDVLAAKDVSGSVRLRAPISSPGIRPLPPAAPYAPGEFNLSDNADGVKLNTSKVAVIAPEDGGQVAVLTRGAAVFSDRNYSFSVIPEPLVGMHYARSPLAQSKARVTQAGYVYVIARNHIVSHLQGQGFEKTNIPSFIPFALADGSYRQPDACVVMQKYVEAGETVEYGSWGITVWGAFQPQDSFVSWISSYSDIPANKRGLLDDASGNGRSNALKFLLGNDPSSADLPPAFRHELDQQGNHTFVFRTAKIAENIVDFEIQATQDLAAFEPGIPAEVIPEGEDADFIYWRVYTDPVEAEKAVFVRLIIHTANS